MICPSCGTYELVRDTRALELQGVTVPAVTGDYCPGCGEVVLDAAESERVMMAIREDADRKDLD